MVAALGLGSREGFVLFWIHTKDSILSAHRNDPIKRQNMVTSEGESSGLLRVLSNF